MRKVNLVSYLPGFMQGYKEPVATLKAEDPEFSTVWNGVDRILYNHFISTADECGIRRFEKLLGIVPSSEDGLASRRSRCQSKWFDRIPYTMKVLRQKLMVLCGGTNFTITDNFAGGYDLTVGTNLELYGQVDELEDVLEVLLPCNVAVNAQNAILVSGAGECHAHGGIAFAQDIFITSYTS